MQHYYQFQVILKPSPDDLQDLFLSSLEAIGIDLLKNDIRFVEDDWESPTLGASGLGWEIWCNGMEVAQFTYMQQMGGIDLRPISGELTYGLERLALYIQNVESVKDLDWNGQKDHKALTYKDVDWIAEEQFSKFNLELANTDMLSLHFKHYEQECQKMLEHDLAIPAYDYCIKASHIFNLLHARGVISATERASYIARVRALAKECCETWLKTSEVKL